MRYDQVIFLQPEDVDLAHEEVLKLGGGAPGVLSRGMIDSATYAPRTGYYASIAEIAAVYVHGIAKNHGYQDGNKRTAALVLMKFLGANGHDVELDGEWEMIIEGVADDSVARDMLVGHVTTLMGGDPIPLDG